MRVLYETGQDLLNEDSVVQKLCSKWTCGAIKLPISYRVDYALTRHGTIEAWAEIKCRGSEYSDMWISLHKWLSGIELSRRTGKPFILVYSFKRGVCWKKLEEEKPTITIGGRTDRGDWQDTEPMAVFPIRQFKLL